MGKRKRKKNKKANSNVVLWYITNFHWFISLIALLLFIFLISYKYVANNEERQLRQITTIEEQKRILRDWKLLPTPDLPTIGEKPAVPYLPELSFEVTEKSEINIWSRESFLLEERLRILVQNHPHELIKNDFNKKIINNEIALNFEPMTKGKMIATFSAIPSSFIIEIEEPIRGDTIPVFSINKTSLAEINTEKDIFFAWLVLYHEYNHYLSWEKAKTKFEKDGYSPMTEKEIEKRGKKGCLLHWRDEKNAYQKECDLAISWGIPYILGDLEVNGGDGLCARIGNEKAFDQYLFILYTSAEMNPSCDRYIAKEVGHPHPEAYY